MFTPTRVLAAMGVYIGSAGGFYLWMLSKEGRNKPPVDLTMSDASKGKLYRKLAQNYDKDIGNEESLMLMPWIRRSVVSKAKGRVLELAGGTGRNLEYYGPKCDVVVTDSSEAMLEVANRKLDRYTSAGKQLARFSFEVQDAQSLPYGDEEFDTVVDAFGLCSVDDPVQLLREAQRVCKRDGQLLLLEHGASQYPMLSNLQARSAQKHYDRWGCVFNRDIEGLVEESGCKILRKERIHFGTTQVIVASPGHSAG